MSLTPNSVQYPRLAVITAALNEEAEIRTSLESLAAQDYPGLLLFPVNDRSTDRTGAIMDEVAAEHSNLHPIHVEALPPRWIGKNHANHLGAEAAMNEGAEWILFTDGDVQFGPDALRKAITYAEERGLDHLALTPELLLPTLGEVVYVTTFIVWFTFRFQTDQVENPRSKQFIGIGAFNLIRAEAYRAIGGHRPLALTVADDMALGKRVKQAGLRQGYLMGEDEVILRWQTDLGATIRGLYKNSYASLDFSLVKTVISSFFLFVLNVLPFFLPWLTSGVSRTAALLDLLALMFVFYRAARAQKQPQSKSLLTALFAGMGGALFVWTLLASAAVTIRQGGVIWRGTLYPIQLLKGNQERV